jgi:hypothetical protein
MHVRVKRAYDRSIEVGRGETGDECSNAVLGRTSVPVLGEAASI